MSTFSVFIIIQLTLNLLALMALKKVCRYSNNFRSANRIVIEETAPLNCSGRFVRKIHHRLQAVRCRLDVFLLGQAP